MTAVAPQDIAIQEIDNEIRRAWAVYREELRDLRGREYEAAEHERWAELQEELERIEQRRSMLVGASA